MTGLLLIDDDVQFCELLSEYLQGQGFDVTAEHDGNAGLDSALAGDFDLAILDIMLPGRDGIEVLKSLRRQSRLPVLMLTARGDDVDRIVGLELGADDYLPKPCNPREVVARIRAILRRAAEAQASTPAVLEVAGIRVDPGGRTASADGNPLALTSTEFAILELLMRSAGRVVTKEDISRKGLGRELGRYDRAVDMHISNIRRKLGQFPDGRDRIETVRGIGYQLISPSS
ncbi:MAG: response regulator transcription factor [Xanthomonadales bacterium]|nr:response regulator transcription factor [Xanthomonadales bacterium]